LRDTGRGARLRRCQKDNEEAALKALAWHGKHDIRCDTVPDPKIEPPRDAIIKVSACAICGSDLHIYVHSENLLLAAGRAATPAN
jgi:hypothetical protein